MKKDFRIGNAKLIVQASTGVKTGRVLNARSWLRWSFQVDWHPAGSATMQTWPLEDTIAVRYARVLSLFPYCKLVVSALFAGSFSRLQRCLPFRLKIESMKFSQIFGTGATRDTPLPRSAYLKACKNIGKSDIISVVPGHWIDPGTETGAPGERGFNLDVANVVERQLRGNGWVVLRPDRDAPCLSWEEYLNWVSKQTLKGVPVLEIHGQGSNADYRGFVLGVIGDTEAPLSKELANDFGIFKMDWRKLGVPRRGGLIVESFNADEVLQMAPWHRTWATRRLANRIVRCIERASFQNRTVRGMIVDLEVEDDLVGLDSSLDHN